MKRILMSLLLILVISLSSNAQIFGKKDVNGVQGYISLRPDKVTYSGNDGNLYYFFYDLQRKTIFITNNWEIYDKIVGHLSANVIDGNRVKLEGPVIKQFTDLFSKKQEEDEEKRSGIKLKKYKIARITGYGLLTKNSK